MRNLYLTDLKRILKDKLFMVTCIIAGAFALFNPLLYKLILDTVDITQLLGMTVNAKSLTFSAFLPGDNLGLVTSILMAIILCKDFSHGTVRNKIISGYPRSRILLSNLLASASVMCGLMLMHAMLTLGFSLFFFPYQPEAFCLSDLGYLLLSILFEMAVYFAIAAILTFCAMNAKNAGICILIYLAISLGFSLVGSIFQVCGMFLDPTSGAYEVINFLNAFNLFNPSLIGAGVTYSAKDILYILIAPVTFTVLATLLGTKLFARKNLK